MNEYNNNEYNNIPDGSSYVNEPVSESQIAMHMTKVMGWMFLGLLTTFVISLLCLATPWVLALLLDYPAAYYGVVIAELVVVVAMTAAKNKLNATAATVMFMGYAALTGVTMAVIALLFEISSIFFVFLLTAAIFLIMAVYGVVTRRDMTKLGPMLTFGLLGIIGAGIVNLFLRSSMLDFIVCAVGVVVFIGLTAYDAKMIKESYIYAMNSGLEEESDAVRKASIFGALTLYLDFINLFLKLLRLLGRRR
jgi:FtsH-binding integral membrane protein